MALQECGLNLDKSSKELKPHGSLEFPCAAYSSCYADRQEDIIPWHWHEELEIIYIENGQMQIRIPSGSFLLERGDCIILNSNILHYGAAVIECRLRSLVFSPALVAGSADLIFAKKYMQPLLACNRFSHYFIRSGEKKDVTDWFHQGFDALLRDCYGYEFTVRESLSRICLFLYGEFKPQAESQNVPLNQDNIRIRKMLAYIHKNFADDISLSEISGMADISERECLRCFRRTIQISPIQYLLKYRIMQGAGMLLGNPAESISEIASLCGFDSPSSFASIFKRFYNCTPREYRSLNIKSPQNKACTAPPGRPLYCYRQEQSGLSFHFRTERA